MLKWLRRLLVGPEMTVEQRQVAVMFMEAMVGRKLFKMDGPAAEQYIREFGFPMREDHGRAN